MRDIRFAIVGPGAAARHHRQAIDENSDHGARLAAVAHYDPDRFEAIERRYGVPCQTLDAVLDRSDVDAVCICTPSGLHADQTVAAARAGKHVLVEKPMALTLDDADRMIAACEDAGVQLGVVYQRRAVPLFQDIREAIEDDRLGTLTLGAVVLPYHRDQAYYDQAAWRGTWAQDGGGVLMNQGIHLIDLLVWYMGDPTDVQAHADTLARHVEVEDTLAATLRFSNGALATVTATTTAHPAYPHRLELYGTQGSIQLEGEDVRRWALDGEATTETPAPPSSSEAGAAGDPAAIRLTGHVGIIRDFMQAIRDRRSPLVDGREGRRSLQAVLEIYAAAHMGRPASRST